MPLVRQSQWRVAQTAPRTAARFSSTRAETTRVFLTEIHLMVRPPLLRISPLPLGAGSYRRSVPLGG